MDFTPTGDTYESEPNDTTANADTLPVNAPVTGKLVSVNDTDFYKVTLDSAAQFSLTLEHALPDNLSKSGNAWTVTCYQYDEKAGSLRETPVLTMQAALEQTKTTSDTALVRGGSVDTQDLFEMLYSCAKSSAGIREDLLESAAFLAADIDENGRTGFHRYLLCIAVYCTEKCRFAHKLEIDSAVTNTLLQKKNRKTGCQITDSRFFRMHCQIIGKGNTAFTSFPPFPKQLP